jgi:hypothetical protein
MLFVVIILLSTDECFIEFCCYLTFELIYENIR